MINTSTFVILFLITDGKSSFMTLPATNSGDMTDMDCSPGEIEEFIKEVRHFFQSNSLFTFDYEHIYLHKEYFYFLQEEACSIQASPEYWSQGSINCKSKTIITCCVRFKSNNYECLGVKTHCI